MNIALIFRGMTPWAKILLLVSFGKAFIAGAGLGLAALGVVDLAGSLGIKPLVDMIAHENIINTFAIGGGIISVVGQVVSLLWKILSR